jgi:hypothetical protein
MAYSFGYTCHVPCNYPKNACARVSGRDCFPVACILHMGEIERHEQISCQMYTISIRI